jgi:hypothetical protein
LRPVFIVSLENNRTFAENFKTDINNRKEMKFVEQIKQLSKKCQCHSGNCEAGRRIAESIDAILDKF